MAPYTALYIIVDTWSSVCSRIMFSDALLGDPSSVPTIGHLAVVLVIVIVATGGTAPKSKFTTLSLLVAGDDGHMKLGPQYTY